MNRFDSFHITIPSSIAKIHRQKFDTVYDYCRNSNKGLSTGTVFKNEHQPWLKIRSNPLRTRIELSSKILADDYPELINLNNIEKVIKVLNGLIDVNKDEFLNFASVSSCDVTFNLPVSRPLQDYIFALSCLTHPDFHVARYRLNTVVFKTFGIALSDRVSFYNKLVELRKRKNKHFLNSLKDQDSLVHKFTKVLRVERNLAKPANVERSLGVSKDRLLKDVLSSPEQPILEIFQRLRSSSTPSFIPPDGFTRYSAEQRHFGNLYLIHHYKLNQSAIFSHVDSRCKKPLARKYKLKLKPLIEQEKEKQGQAPKDSYLEELEALIKNA